MKRLITGIVLLATLTIGFSFPGTPAYAATSTDAAKAELCKGVSGQAGGTCGTGGPTISKAVRGIINLLSIIAGFVAVIMIIISGMKYITSSGDAQSVSSAKKTLIYAMVGLVVVALAQVIVRFVLGNVK